MDSVRARLLSTSTRRRGLLLVAVAGALAVGIVPALAGNTATNAAKPGTAQQDALGNYDSRNDGSATKKVLEAKAASLAAKPSAGIKNLRGQLGIQGLVDVDPLTATPRLVGKLDGFLTGASKSSASTVALNYVRAHEDVFGLSGAQIGVLRLRQDYVDIGGTHHLSFIQTVNGVPVFGNGLKAHVTKDGKLIGVDGSPLAYLPSSFSAPKLSPSEARDAALANVLVSRKAAVVKAGTDATRATEFAGGDRASLVVFQTLTGPRLGWQVLNLKDGWQSVMDAQTGKVLYRYSTMAKDSGQAWRNYPGAPVGGAQQTVFMTANGWIPNGSTHLEGNNTHVWLDLNDDDAANAGEEVGPSAFHKYNYPFTDFTASDTSGLCSADFPCSWDQNTAFSWQTNQNQDAVQMFYFVNTFHDWLEGGQIGFTPAAGNFEAGDKVEGNALDGANITGVGFPDGNHIDNANFNTPPDGISPRMQMYLFVFDPASPFIPGNSGDEADVVYHEYTHGLSNRLVVDGGGNSTLGNIQAGSMGEAWSDWYAMDYLVRKGLMTDVAGHDGDLRVGQYVGAGQDLIRTQPMDCAVGSTSPLCPGALAGQGGYTYGDFGKIIGRPEVHADGEIWGETLWDLRKSLGTDKSESLVTRAMELSPANPSYLDMRNSILQADLVNYGGANATKIWKVFAARGMGWFAGSIDGDDARPVEDFSMPPKANTPKGNLTGVVTDIATGTPLAGINVAFGGHNSGFANNYATTTDGTGHYTISGIFAGTYPKVFAAGGGYDLQSATISIANGTNVKNWALRKDWAASANGGSVTDFNGVDFNAFGCGPNANIDQSQGAGWSSDVVQTSAVPPGLDIEPRFMVIKLPVVIDINEIDVNPSNICGDPGSSSTGDYSVETSPDGSTWTTVSSGHFGIADRNYHAISLGGGGLTGVQYVRFTMIRTQVVDLGGFCPGPFGGCDFIDSVEVGVYGAP